jgi:hypothetical protein
MLALGDVARHTTGVTAQAAVAHLRRFTARSRLGSASTCAAIALAGKLGWHAAYASCWRISTPTADMLRGSYYPIEAEEAMPWMTALPSSAAMLGLLTPAHLIDLPGPDVYLRTTQVAGRAAVSDGLYSLIALGAAPQLYQTTLGKSWPERPSPYQLKVSYRSQPSDGQFSPRDINGSTWTPLFQVTSHRNVIKAMHGHLSRAAFHWTYEWFDSFTPTVAAQYVEHGLVPPVAAVPDPVPRPDLVEVPPAPPARYPEYPRGTAAELREVLGQEWDELVDIHALMRTSVGHQVEATRYDSISRSLAAVVTGLPLETLHLHIPPSIVPSMWSWLVSYAMDAAAWSVSPGLQADCMKVADYALSKLRYEAEPTPPPRIEKAPYEPPPSFSGMMEKAERQALLEDFRQRPSTSAPAAGDDETDSSGSTGSQGTPPIQEESEVPAEPTVGITSLPQGSGFPIQEVAFQTDEVD